MHVIIQEGKYNVVSIFQYGKHLSLHAEMGRQYVIIFTLKVSNS